MVTMHWSTTLLSSPWSRRMSDDLKIDLSRYRTNELAANVAEILSVPESIRTVFRTAFFAIACLILVNSLIQAFGNGGWLIGMISSVYALVIAIVLGGVLGLLRVASMLVSRSETLMQLTLQTSQEIATGCPSGRSRFP